MKEEIEKSKMYCELKDKVSRNIFGCMLVNDIIKYLIMFPENEWFSTTNSVNNPLPNQWDMIEKLANNNLIIRLDIPNGKCTMPRFKYRLDLQYDANAYLNWH